MQDGILVLALTKEGETGFTGTPPADNDGDPAGTGGVGSEGSGSGGELGIGGELGGVPGADDGTGGSLGALPGSGGLGGQGNDDGSGDSSADAGCSCHTATGVSRGATPWGLGLLGFGMLLLRIRRRAEGNQLDSGTAAPFAFARSDRRRATQVVDA